MKASLSSADEATSPNRRRMLLPVATTATSASPRYVPKLLNASIVTATATTAMTANNDTVRAEVVGRPVDGVVVADATGCFIALQSKVRPQQNDTR